MHREFRKLLDKATAFSQFIIAVNIDIRDFSTFSLSADSSEAAIFIRKVYKKLIDEYFPGAAFFKPAGDGLLIFIPYLEDNLQVVLNDTIITCSKLMVEFGAFCSNDPMINFEVPQRLGIGLSRGATCKLVSEDKILDYSGKVINLASRLMDLARPSGIVFDAKLGIDLIPEEFVKDLEKDKVYIKGISEREPIEIFHSKDAQIPSINKRPFDKIKWNSNKDKKKLKQIRDLGPRFHYPIPIDPIDPNLIEVKISYPAIVRGRKQKGVLSFINFANFQYMFDKGKPKVMVQFDALANRLESLGIKDDWEIQIEIIYPEQ